MIIVTIKVYYSLIWLNYPYLILLIVMSCLKSDETKRTITALHAHVYKLAYTHAYKHMKHTHKHARTCAYTNTHTY